MFDNQSYIWCMNSIACLVFRGNHLAEVPLQEKGRTLKLQLSAHTTNISHQQSELRYLLKLPQQVLIIVKRLVSEQAFLCKGQQLLCFVEGPPTSRSLFHNLFYILKETFRNTSLFLQSQQKELFPDSMQGTHKAIFPQMYVTIAVKSVTQPHPRAMYWEHDCKKVFGSRPIECLIQKPAQKVGSGSCSAPAEWQVPLVWDTALLYRGRYLERYPEVRDGKRTFSNAEVQQ